MRGSPLLAGAVSQRRPETAQKTEVRGVVATAGEAAPDEEALATQDSRQAP
jgi:hypothetical protein